jgi:hypothetical protein
MYAQEYDILVNALTVLFVVGLASLAVLLSADNQRGHK